MWFKFFLFLLLWFISANGKLEEMPSISFLVTSLPSVSIYENAGGTTTGEKWGNSFIGPHGDIGLLVNSLWRHSFSPTTAHVWQAAAICLRWPPANEPDWPVVWGRSCSSASQHRMEPVEAVASSELWSYISARHLPCLASYFLLIPWCKSSPYNLCVYKVLWRVWAHFGIKMFGSAIFNCQCHSSCYSMHHSSGRSGCWQWKKSSGIFQKITVHPNINLTIFFSSLSVSRSLESNKQSSGSDDLFPSSLPRLFPGNLKALPSHLRL